MVFLKILKLDLRCSKRQENQLLQAMLALRALNRKISIRIPAKSLTVKDEMVAVIKNII
jgi:hypothetical protein